MSISPFPFASTTFTIESLDFTTAVFALSVAAEKVLPTFLAVSLRFSLNDFVSFDSFSLFIAPFRKGNVFFARR